MAADNLVNGFSPNTVALPGVIDNSLDTDCIQDPISYTFTGTTTLGSNVITGVNDVTNLEEGMTVTGTGIPTNAFIIGTTTSPSITVTLNVAATASGAGTFKAGAPCGLDTNCTQGDGLHLIKSVTYEVRTLKIPNNLRKLIRFNSTTTSCCAPVSFTADTTAGSATLANASTTTGINVGMAVSGAGIPANSFVLSIVGASITINYAATATATGVACVASYGSTGLVTHIGVRKNDIIVPTPQASIFGPTVTFTGNTTSGDNVITGVPTANFAWLYVGQVVTGTGIPNTPQTWIAALSSSTGKVTLSADATATASGTTFTCSCVTDSQVEPLCDLDAYCSLVAPRQYVVKFENPSAVTLPIGFAGSFDGDATISGVSFTSGAWSDLAVGMQMQFNGNGAFLGAPSGAISLAGFNQGAGTLTITPSQSGYMSAGACCGYVGSSLDLTAWLTGLHYLTAFPRFPSKCASAGSSSCCWWVEGYVDPETVCSNDPYSYTEYANVNKGGGVYGCVSIVPPPLLAMKLAIDNSGSGTGALIMPGYVLAPCFGVIFGSTACSFAPSIGSPAVTVPALTNLFGAVKATIPAGDYNFFTTGFIHLNSGLTVFMIPN